MTRPTDVRRVIVVVLDGLRPDAVDAFELASVRNAARSGASTMCGQTVSPSLTWPALTSILTGVSPEVHGVLEERVHVPRPRTKLHPVAALLARGGYPSTAFMSEIPPLYRGIAGRIAKGLGFSEARFVGANATDVVRSAQSTLRTQRRGLIFFHWADADRVGHEHGWMSPEYGAAARQLDSALDVLLDSTDALHDRHTLVVLLADHGGGGVVDNHHEGAHPLNTTIPLILCGGAVARVPLESATLLDVPTTICWALDVKPHESYAGRALIEAFASVRVTTDAIELLPMIQTSSAVPTASSWPTRTSPG